MLLCGNNALKKNIIHLSMVHYVYVLLYNAEKYMFRYIKSYYNI
jgi:hypothetical protein